MKNMRHYLIGLAAALTLSACGDKAPPPPPETKAPAAPAPVPPAPQSPDTFSVRFETTKGPFVVAITRAWSPMGADRFLQLVNEGYFKDNRFFRVMPGFIVQFGMHGDAAVNTRWGDASIPDDSVKQSNRRGTIVYANAGPNTRSTQMFINLADNPGLDDMGFSPLGRVVSGMNAVDAIFPGYGETPQQGAIAAEGNRYLIRDFPKLDYILSAAVVSPTAAK